MFKKWLTNFSFYFNQGSSDSLRSKGQSIEQSLDESANYFANQYGIDTFSQKGNFQKYWSLVQYSLTQKGMNHQDFSELTGLAMSFNEGNGWC